MNITWGNCFWNTGNRKRLGTGWMTWRIVFNTLQNEKKLHHTGSENTVRLKFLKYHMIKCPTNWNPQCLPVLDLHVFASLCEWLRKLEVICIKKQEFINVCFSWRVMILDVFNCQLCSWHMTILYMYTVDIDWARIQWSGTQQGTECSYAGSFSIQCTKTN